jgi:hypothetical protein
MWAWNNDDAWVLSMKMVVARLGSEAAQWTTEKMDQISGLGRLPPQSPEVIFIHPTFFSSTRTA